MRNVIMLIAGLLFFASCERELIKAEVIYENGDKDTVVFSCKKVSNITLDTQKGFGAGSPCLDCGGKSVVCSVRSFRILERQELE